MAYLSGNGVQIPSDVRYLDMYEQLASDIDPDRSTLDDKLRRLEFTIARILELFELSWGSSGLPMCAAIYTGPPRLRIRFTYDRELVTVMGIQRILPSQM